MRKIRKFASEYIINIPIVFDMFVGKVMEHRAHVINEYVEVRASAIHGSGIFASVR